MCRKCNEDSARACGIAVTCITDTKTSFKLPMPNSILKIIRREACVLWKWKAQDKMHVHAYFRVLILAGVYKSTVRGAETDRIIFHASDSGDFSMEEI